MCIERFAVSQIADDSQMRFGIRKKNDEIVLRISNRIELPHNLHTERISKLENSKSKLLLISPDSLCVRCVLILRWNEIVIKYILN